METSLTKIAFEQIQDNYWYGAYGEFRVVMMKDSGYINATKLCMDGNKRFIDWSRLKGSDQLTQVLEKQLENDRCAHLHNGNLAIKKVNTGNKTSVGIIISGTYCHPDLIPHIACWISPIFALKVSKIVNAYMVMEFEVQLATTKQEIERQQLEIERQQQIASKLEADIYDMDHAMGEIREAATQQKQQLEGVVMEQDGTIEELADKVVKKKAFIGKLYKTVDDKERRHRIWSSTHGFTMVRTNDHESKLPYYAIRCKSGSMSGSVKKVRTKFPNSVLVYQHSNVANPINLYNRLKASGILKFNGNYCSTKVGEAELIDKLGELCTIVKPELAICKRLQDM